MEKQDLKKFVQILESNVHTRPRINTNCKWFGDGGSAPDDEDDGLPF